MVKPDGVHQNLTGAVLAFLAGRGFRPLSSVPVGLTPALRSRLYATTRPPATDDAGVRERPARPAGFRRTVR